MGEKIALDLLVRAIAEGFDKLSSDVARLGTGFDKSAKLIIDSSGKISTVTQQTGDAMNKAAKSSDGLAEAQKRMGFAADMAKQKQAELKRQLDATVDVSSKLAVGFGAVAAGGAALLGSSVQLAARVETLGVVVDTLGRNVGMTHDQMTQLTTDIMDQGITMQSARQSIARMIQGNIDLAKATDLARMAQNAAVIAGINSSEALERLTQAISSGQVEMLRSMGISVTFEQGYKNLAATLGKSAEKLTEEEKAQARLNIVLSAGTNIAGAYESAMDTAGKKVSSLARHIEESRRMLGEMWLPVYADAVDALTGSLKAWEGLDQGVKDGVSGLLGMATAVAGMEAVLFGLIAALIKAKAAMAAWNATVVIGGVGAGTFAASIALPVAAVAALVSGLVILNARQQQSIANFRAGEAAARESATSYEEYRKAVIEAAKAEGMRVRGRDLTSGYGRQGPITVQENVIVTRQEFSLKGERTEAEAAKQMQQNMRALASAESDAAIQATLLQMAAGPMAEALVRGATEGERFSLVLDHMAVLQAGLAAGLSGTLQGALDGYGDTMMSLKDEEAQLNEEIAKNSLLYDSNKTYVDKLRSSKDALNEQIAKATRRYGEDSEQVKDLTDAQQKLNIELEAAKKQYGPNSEKVKDLTAALEENKTKQQEAAAALAETTAQMIYQQAAAGLDAQAALELARAMGLLSEQDYTVATSIAELRTQFDANRDGAITAGEGAADYAGKVELINQAVQNLIAAGLPVTMENINAQISHMTEDADLATQAIDNTTTAASNIGNTAPGAIGKVTSSMADARKEAEEAKKRIDYVQAAIDRLNGKTIDITINTWYKEYYQRTGTGSNPRQHGGDIQKGKVYWVGEKGPEPFVAPESGYMLGHQEAKSILAGSSMPAGVSMPSGRASTQIPSGGGGMGPATRIIPIGTVNVFPPEGANGAGFTSDMMDFLAEQGERAEGKSFIYAGS